MKKTLSLVSLCLIIILAIVGCTNNTPADEDIDNPIEENLDDNEGENEDSSPDDNEEDNSVSESPSASGDLLSLGETGVMETAIGNFEVTPTSVRFLSEVGGEKPFSEVFVVIDLTIKNVDTDTIISEDIISARLHSLDDSGSTTNFDDFEEINNFEGEIEPGKTMSGEAIFDFRKLEGYQLSFGAAYLDSLSNEVRWEFDAEEAE